MRMLKLLKFFFAFLFLLVLAVVVIYFLPQANKEWILTKAAGIIPEALKKRAEEFVLTPQEQRARIIQNIEERLSDIEKETISPADAATLAREAHTLLGELKSKNDELSFPEIAKTKLVDALLNRNATSSEQCTP